MTKKKEELHWYVLVITNDGPVFVTSIDYTDKTAHWDKAEKPIEISELWAKDIVLGLNWCNSLAYTICSRWEIDNQPYRYADGCLSWKANDAE